MQLALLLTIGKYIFVALVYVFAYLVYRGMMTELVRAEPTLPARSRASVRSRAPQRPAPAATPAQRPPVSRPEPVAQRPVVPAPAPVMPAPAPVAPAAPVIPVAPVAPVAAAPAVQARPRLVVVKAAAENARLGPEIELSAAATIGRSRDSTITLDDRYVSGNHAQVYLREGTRRLLDRGSTNGTLLNGRPVEGEVPLRERDQITIGTTIFEYREA